MVGNGSCGNCCSPSLIDDSMGVMDDSGIRKCGIWKGSWEQATEMKNGRWTDETGLWTVVVSWWPAFMLVLNREMKYVWKWEIKCIRNLFSRMGIRNLFGKS